MRETETKIDDRIALARARCRIPLADDFVYSEIFVHNEYAALQRFNLPKSPLILDLGAHIGFASLYMRKLWPDARIVAFEPDAGNAELYALNCPENELRRVAVSNGRGFGFIQQHKRSCGHYLTICGDGAAVPVHDMGSIISELGNVDLLKCDVEGSEVGIFTSSRDWINKVSHMAVEVHGLMFPAGWSLRHFYDALNQNGYRFETVHEQHEQIAFVRRLDS